jgi:hypothetical protein
MKQKVIIIVLLLMWAGNASSQSSFFYVNWDYNIPLSNTNWIDKGSAKGAKVGYRGMIGDGKFSAGVDFNWSSFNAYQPLIVIENPTGALSTDYFKYVYTYGATVSGQYYLKKKEDSPVSPYVGLGLGANYNEYIIYYNIYQDSDKKWGFLARPEAGVLVQFGRRRSVGAMAAVHYDFSTNQSDRYQYKNFSTVGFQIGLIFMNRY